MDLPRKPAITAAVIRRFHVSRALLALLEHVAEVGPPLPLLQLPLDLLGQSLQVLHIDVPDDPVVHLDSPDEDGRRAELGDTPGDALHG